MGKYTTVIILGACEYLFCVMEGGESLLGIGLWLCNAGVEERCLFLCPPNVAVVMPLVEV